MLGNYQYAYAPYICIDMSPTRIYGYLYGYQPGILVFGIGCMVVRSSESVTYSLLGNIPRATTRQLANY